MIASLRGTVIDKGLDFAVIECSGVGYKCLATATTIAELPRGAEAFVHTTLVVREDSHTLYAFSNAEERAMFGLLQTVSGVGAKLALAILSVLSPQGLSQAISQGDTKTLQKAPGVGKRVAERMAVDLKDKVTALVSAPEQTVGADGDGTSPQMTLPAGDVQDQVTEALEGLGFTATKAQATIAAVAKSEGDEVVKDASLLLRSALKYLGSSR
ncbi:MAG TPA: Holliday junction branch migration protein RuvA [Candidatus Corynebacterium gallistercoris]|uniref:Holliday junction branch migration complex subunit RuvA n=1 Tax=Candidatus Corynebacterium gallistercoris TaxID=2838530 RepID=A0A9D1UQ36_9CORY|nr:Holliday junction branch migration protein RuvA [Candidatus Corynebacterium gallistercoris]